MSPKTMLCLALTVVVLLCPLSGLAEGAQAKEEKISGYEGELGYTVLSKAEYPSSHLDFESFGNHAALDYGALDWKAYAVYDNVDERSLNDYIAYLEACGYSLDFDGDSLLGGRYIRMEGRGEHLYTPIRVEITYYPDDQDMVTAIPLISATLLKAITSVSTQTVRQP